MSNERKETIFLVEKANKGFTFRPEVVEITLLFKFER
jgi:hypothetical protein